MDKEEQTFDEFREGKRKKKAQMTAMQNLPYEIKVKRAAIRVREFIEKCDELGFNTHVSVGGLDSITLLYFIRSLGYDIPAISTRIWVSCIKQKNSRKDRDFTTPDREK